jgi:hypothetical protein
VVLVDRDRAHVVLVVELHRQHCRHEDAMDGGRSEGGGRGYGRREAGLGSGGGVREFGSR